MTNIKPNQKPCSCPKGGMYTDGVVCTKCDGSEWVEDIKPNEWWFDHFKEINRRLNLREETTSGFSEQAYIRNKFAEMLRLDRQERSKSLLEKIEDKIGELDCDCRNAIDHDTHLLTAGRTQGARTILTIIKEV